MRQRRVADLAQLAEHVTSNDEVGGSNPLVSINKYVRHGLKAMSFLWSKQYIKVKVRFAIPFRKTNYNDG